MNLPGMDISASGPGLTSSLVAMALLNLIRGYGKFMQRFTGVVCLVNKGIREFRKNAITWNFPDFFNKNFKMPKCRVFYILSKFRDSLQKVTTIFFNFGLPAQSWSRNFLRIEFFLWGLYFMGAKSGSLNRLIIKGNILLAGSRIFYNERI